jgi:hypothetical protein
MGSDQEIHKIEIDKETLRHLNTLRKWTMFLAVSGFIFLGLIIILGLLTGTFLTAFSHSDKIPGIPDLLVIAAFIAAALINFFPVFFLFRLSKHLAVAVSNLDSRAMHNAIKNIKRFFIYIGIVLIVIILAYISSLILAGTSTSFLHGF